jgi:hypothetical protein
MRFVCLALTLLALAACGATRTEQVPVTRQVLVTEYRPCPAEKDLPPAPVMQFETTNPQGPPERETSALALDRDAALADSQLLRAAINACHKHKEKRDDK